MNPKCRFAHRNSEIRVLDRASRNVGTNGSKQGMYDDAGDSKYVQALQALPRGAMPVQPSAMPQPIPQTNCHSLPVGKLPMSAADRQDGHSRGGFAHDLVGQAHDLLDALDNSHDQRQLHEGLSKAQEIVKYIETFMRRSGHHQTNQNQQSPDMMCRIAPQVRRNGQNGCHDPNLGFSQHGNLLGQHIPQRNMLEAPVSEMDIDRLRRALYKFREGMVQREPCEMRTPSTSDFEDPAMYALSRQTTSQLCEESPHQPFEKIVSEECFGTSTWDSLPDLDPQTSTIHRNYLSTQMHAGLSVDGHLGRNSAQLGNGIRNGIQRKTTSASCYSPVQDGYPDGRSGMGWSRQISATSGLSPNSATVTSGSLPPYPSDDFGSCHGWSRDTTPLAPSTCGWSRQGTPFACNGGMSGVSRQISTNTNGGDITGGSPNKLATSAFQVSNALGLRLTVKGTFLDCENLSDEDLVEPKSLKRSASAEHIRESEDQAEWCKFKTLLRQETC